MENIVKNRKKTILTLIILIVLALVAGYLIYKEVSKESKEIQESKKFLNNLLDNEMIASEEVDDIEFTTEKIMVDNKEFYKVTSEKYGFDIDSNYNVIGFNYNVCGEASKFLSIGEAKEIAVKYISILANEDYMFKEVVETENSYSSFIFDFNRYEGSYPFYSDEIIIQVNRYNGYLSGYTNTSSRREAPEVNIKVESEVAENIADKDFLANNLDVSEVHNDTFQAFYEDKTSGKIELCHIVTVEGINSDNKEVRVKYIISTETGEIVNIIKDNVKDNKKNTALKR